MILDRIRSEGRGLTFCAFITGILMLQGRGLERWSAGLRIMEGEWARGCVSVAERDADRSKQQKMNIRKSVSHQGGAML